jgi:hypothetical protein
MTCRDEKLGKAYAGILQHLRSAGRAAPGCRTSDAALAYQRIPTTNDILCRQEPIRGFDFGRFNQRARFGPVQRSTSSGSAVASQQTNVGSAASVQPPEGLHGRAEGSQSQGSSTGGDAVTHSTPVGGKQPERHQSSLSQSQDTTPPLRPGQSSLRADGALNSQKGGEDHAGRSSVPGSMPAALPSTGMGSGPEASSARPHAFDVNSTINTTLNAAVPNSAINTTVNAAVLDSTLNSDRHEASMQPPVKVELMKVPGQGAGEGQAQEDLRKGSAEIKGGREGVRRPAPVPRELSWLASSGSQAKGVSPSQPAGAADECDTPLDQTLNPRELGSPRRGTRLVNKPITTGRNASEHLPAPLTAQVEPESLEGTINPVDTTLNPRTASSSSYAVQDFSREPAASMTRLGDFGATLRPKSEAMMPIPEMESAVTGSGWHSSDQGSVASVVCREQSSSGNVSPDHRVNPLMAPIGNTGEEAGGRVGKGNVCKPPSAINAPHEKLGAKSMPGRPADAPPDASAPPDIQHMRVAPDMPLRLGNVAATVGKVDAASFRDSTLGPQFDARRFRVGPDHPLPILAGKVAGGQHDSAGNAQPASSSRWTSHGQPYPQTTQPSSKDPLGGRHAPAPDTGAKGPQARPGKLSATGTMPMIDSMPQSLADSARGRNQAQDDAEPRDLPSTPAPGIPDADPKGSVPLPKSLTARTVQSAPFSAQPLDGTMSLGSSAQGAREASPVHETSLETLLQRGSNRSDRLTFLCGQVRLARTTGVPDQESEHLAELAARNVRQLQANIRYSLQADHAADVHAQLAMVEGDCEAALQSWEALLEGPAASGGLLVRYSSSCCLPTDCGCSPSKGRQQMACLFTSC